MNMPEMKDFYDIYQMWHKPWWQHAAVKYGIAALVVIVLCLVLWCVITIIIKRRKRQTPWDYALSSLQVLKDSKFFNESLAPLFYANLTNIIKIYCENRFNFDSMGKTDNELLSYLEKQVSFNQELLPVVNDILNHAALVKFANVAALVDQMEHDLNATIMLVKQTVPREHVK